SGGYLLSSKLVLENGEQWSIPFFIMAIPTFIVGILFYTILKEKVIRPGEEAARPAAELRPQEKISLKEIFSNRKLL
ncbi:MFS transporter, partial [Enterococcus faecalis]